MRDYPGVQSIRNRSRFGAHALGSAAQQKQQQDDSCPRGGSQLKGLGQFLCAESRMELEEREGPRVRRVDPMEEHQNEAGAFMPGLG